MREDLKNDMLCNPSLLPYRKGQGGFLIYIAMKTSYKTQGTCSSHINVEVEDGIVTHVQFYGGCNGNLQGLCRLVTGMKVADVIARLEGIRCNHRPTSCPDQLCQALRSLPTS